MRRTRFKQGRRTDRTSDCAGRRPSVAAGKLRRMMSPKPVRIAQISDLHIKPPGSLAYGRVDTAKRARTLRGGLERIHPEPDFVVISGDLADTPTAEEYRTSQAPAGTAQAAVCRHSRQSRFARTDARRVSDAGIRLSIRAAQSDGSKSAGSTWCCWIQAYTASRMANSTRPTLRWLEQLGYPRQTGPRYCSCTTRRSRPASGTWTARIFSMPANLPPSSDVIRACN